MKLIIASRDDPAAVNIVDKLLKIYNFVKRGENPELYVLRETSLVCVSGDVTRLQELPVSADEVIIASRHVSESGRSALTVHVPGHPAKYELAIAAPETVKAALRTLIHARDELRLSYDVSLEATHHGPAGLGVPVTFVEIGSSPKEWEDPRAGRAAARAIMAAAESSIRGPKAIGFGGTHYSPRHTELVLRTNICVGHVFPKYLGLDERLIRTAVDRTRGGVEIFALDWKGLRGRQREMLRNIGEKLGVQVIRESDLLKNL
ncbi:MAG: hypothetical protein J7J17_00645 [Hadesarchaea archaeon]|nr:hypothetical protein [Hadesarchaea archaeon]